VSDRTGFPMRAEHTRRQWNNIYTELETWEPRQPQDLVRGVKDKQSVQDARPLAPNTFVGPTNTTLSANAAIGQTVIPVASMGGFAVGENVGVMLDSGILFNTTLNGIGNGTLTLAKPLPYTAASGNVFYNYTQRISVAGVTP
jgi:hypothetical protein